ncbi:MAG: NINE protein [Mycobacteriaceae bacterium]|uniref:TM2 domain-containing protein n=1 Tax=Corynebacterium sp. TaxID=1720 RepID=UPI003F999A48
MTNPFDNPNPNEPGGFQNGPQGNNPDNQPGRWSQGQPGFQQPGNQNPGYQQGFQPAYPPQNYQNQVPQPYQQPGYPQGVYAGQTKSKVAAALLAFFLGGLGAHNFYLGQTGRAFGHITLLVLSFIPFLGLVFGFINFVWWIVEFIMILTGSGNYARDTRGVPVT